MCSLENDNKANNKYSQLCKKKHTQVQAYKTYSQYKHVPMNFFSKKSNR